MSDRPDTLGCVHALRGAPEHAELAVVAVQDAALPSAEDATSIVVAGLGTAGTAARVVASTAAELATRPVLAHTAGPLPAWVDASTLVVVIDLAESPVATSDAVTAAVAAGATVITVASPHAARPVGAGTHIVIDPGTAVARFGLAPASLAALVVLDRLGFLPGVEAAIDHAVQQLRRRRDEVFGTGSDLVTRLARRIGRSIPLITGAGPVGAIAAAHWKAQCNANAKIPAFASSLPELASDEIAGWGQHGDVTRQVLVSVLLRHDTEPATPVGAYDVLVPILEESLGAVRTVAAAGDGALAQLLDLAYLGDLVSVELAMQEGLDPGPAPALELLRP
jgi:hypothetical protein